MRLLGEVLGPFSRGAPEGSQGRPEPKKLRKVRPFFVAYLFFGHPQVTHFGIFSICAVFVWGYFLGAVLEGLRAQFLKDFGVMFELFFRVFLKLVGGARF